MRPDRPSDSPLSSFHVEGLPLSYTDEGHGAPAVITVPGLPGSTRDFRWLAPALSPHVRVLRFDPPGYGLSPRSGFIGLDVAQRAEPVLALIEHLGTGPAVLVGHSAGAGVVAYMAAHRPELVRAAVMLAPAGPKPHLARRPMRLLAQTLRIPGARQALDPVIRHFYSVRGFPSYLTDDERAHAMLDALEFDFTQYREDLVQMSCPTMVAWAHDDPIIPASTFEALEALVPDGPRLRFHDGAHSVQKTHAAQIAAALLDMVG